MESIYEIYAAEYIRTFAMRPSPDIIGLEYSRLSRDEAIAIYRAIATLAGVTEHQMVRLLSNEYLRLQEGDHQAGKRLETICQNI